MTESSSDIVSVHPSPGDEVLFIEEIFNRLDEIDSASPQSVRQLARELLLKIIRYESGVVDIGVGRRALINRLHLPNPAISTLDRLLGRVGVLILDGGTVALTAETASALEEPVSISELREFVNIYSGRKFIAISIFGFGYFPSVSVGSSVRLFSPLVDSVVKDERGIHVSMTLGVLVSGMKGQQVELKARLKARSNSESGINSSVTGIYRAISSLRIVDNFFLEESRRVDFSLPALGSANESFDLELIMVTSVGEILDKVSLPLPTELRAVSVGLIADLQKKTSLESDKLRSKNQTEGSSNPPSQIESISLRAEGSEVVVTYQLHLREGNGVGYYVVVDLLDDEGRILTVSRWPFGLLRFTTQRHEQTREGKLSFRRFIPVSRGTDAILAEDLVIPRRALGLGFGSREIVVSLFLFNSSEEKIDEVEQGFLITIKPRFFRAVGRFFQQLFSFNRTAGN